MTGEKCKVCGYKMVTRIYDGYGPTEYAYCNKCHASYKAPVPVKKSKKK